jgi:hypothetical protein
MLLYCGTCGDAVDSDIDRYCTNCGRDQANSIMRVRARQSSGQPIGQIRGISSFPVPEPINQRQSLRHSSTGLPPGSALNFTRVYDSQANISIGQPYREYGTPSRGRNTPQLEAPRLSNNPAASTLAQGLQRIELSQGHHSVREVPQTSALGSVWLNEEEVESFRSLLLGSSSQQVGARVSPQSLLLEALSKTEPARPISTQQGLMAKPKLPVKPCSRSNVDVWPFDFYPRDSYRLGTWRIKYVPETGSCGRCMMNHPTDQCQFWSDFIEVWISKGSRGFCMEDRCQFPGTHKTSDHGLGQWLDHPENPALPEDLTWLSRPWRKQSRWLPLPKYYYTGDIKLLLSKGAPRLPVEYVDEGFSRGLWDRFRPFYYSFECVVALDLNRPKPEFTRKDNYPSDNQTLKGYHLFSGAKTTERHLLRTIGEKQASNDRGLNQRLLFLILVAAISTRNSL